MNTIGSRKSMQHRILTLFVFFLLAFGVVAPGNAATLDIIGNETTVFITSYTVLTGAGFDINSLGDASDLEVIMTPPPNPTTVGVITFPITGGSLDTTTDNALIEHDNSGFSLTKEVDGEGRTIFFRDLLIDTEEALLFADTTYKLTTDPDEPEIPLFSEFPLFDLSPAGDQIKLTYTALAAFGLDGFFQTDFFQPGAEFGEAIVDLQVVPIPAALPLLLSGLAGLAVMRRKFRR